jgi:hypothetical protein
MENKTKTESQEELLKQFRAEVSAKPKTKQSQLAQYDDFIAAMRNDRGTWRTIALYLSKAGFQVSGESVRSYWHRHHRKPRTSASRTNPEQLQKKWIFNPPGTLE